jgi:hypothetical protein
MIEKKDLNIRRCMHKVLFVDSFAGQKSEIALTNLKPRSFLPIGLVNIF